MKKMFSLLVALMAMAAVYAQSSFHSAHPNVRQLAPGQHMPTYAKNLQRANIVMTLDYDSAERYWANQHPLTDSVFPSRGPFSPLGGFSTWDINSNFDSSDYFTLRTAIQTYDTLINPANNFAGTSKVNSTIRVDSFSIFLYDSNGTGSSDSLTISIFDKSAAVVSGTGLNKTITTTPIWSQKFGATTNFFGPGSGQYIFNVPFYPNVTLPAGHTFGIRVDFKGDVNNSFGVAASWRNDCGTNSIVGLADSNVLAPHNSSFLFNWSTRSTLYNWNTNTPVSGATSFAPCDLLPINNFYFFPSITVTTSGASTCPTAVSISEATQGTLTANITGGTGSFTYNWHIYNSFGQSYNATTATVSNVPANFSATVTVSATGCAPVTSSIFQSTTPTNCATNYTETATTLPSGDILIHATGGTGGPYFYYFATANQTSQTSYSDTGKIATLGLTAGQSYTLIVIDVNGCTLAVTNTYTAYTNTCPHINIAAVQQANGDEVAIVSGGVAPYTYKWDLGNIFAFTDTVPASSFNGVNGVTLFLGVTDANGCKDTISFIHSAPACPTITVTATQLSTTLAHATATGGTGPYTFAWSNAGNVRNDTAFNVSVGNTYTVTAVDHNGCTGIASITISSGSCPTITATAAQVGTSSSATASATGGASPYTYRWGTVPVQTTATATGLTAGTYTVTAADRNGCTGSASVTILPNSIEEINGVTSFSIYPNPSNGVFTTTARFAAASDVTISIVDMTGNKVYESSDKAVKEITKPINLSAVAAGVYIINVKTNNGTANQRIIIK